VRFGCSICMLAGLIAVTGCEQPSSVPTSGKVTSEDVRHDAGKAVDTATEFSQQTKAEFQKKLEVRLKELDAEMVVLREKGRDLKDEAKMKWEEKLVELETKRDTARAKLAEVGESSAEAWKDLQKGAQAAWNDMDKAFSEASLEF
jgi:TolA-binding protein